MKENEKLEFLILRVGDKYLKAPIQMKIIVGKVLAGDIKLKKAMNRYLNIHHNGIVIRFNFAT